MIKTFRSLLTRGWEVYLVDSLLTLFVFLSLLFHLLSLLYVIDELEQVPQVQNHRLSLGRQEHIVYINTITLTETHHLQSIDHDLVKQSSQWSTTLNISYAMFDL